MIYLHFYNLFNQKKEVKYQKYLEAKENRNLNQHFKSPSLELQLLSIKTKIYE